MASKIEIDIEKEALSIAKSLSTKMPEGWDLDRIKKLREFDGKVGPIPVQLIVTKHNIRKAFDRDSREYQELLESVKKHGILQSPVVTIVDNKFGLPQILLVGGGRRIEVAKDLGYTEVKCLIRIFDAADEHMTASMAENLNRKNLHPLDVAECFGELAQQGYKQTELSKLFGRDRITILRDIKMSKWPPEAKALIRANPEKFTSKNLTVIARKKMDDEDVLREVKAVINGKQSAARSPKPESRVLDYFNEYSLDLESKKSLLSALQAMKFINSRQARTIESEIV